jgi:flagellar secretion chaperone FliS
MATSAHDTYLESRILAADPLELVRVLYRLAIDNVREARENMEKGDIPARAKAISTASQAIGELHGSLDPAAGGEIARRLAQLYEYMQRRLLEASLRQSVEPLNEVLGLLSTLSEAWQAIRTDPAPAAFAPPAGMPYLEETPALQQEYASQSWSA